MSSSQNKLGAYANEIHLYYIKCFKLGTLKIGLSLMLEEVIILVLRGGLSVCGSKSLLLEGLKWCVGLGTSIRV